MILLESSECACQWALRSYGFLCLFHLYNLNLGFCILRTGFLSICERFRCWTSAFPYVGTGRFKVPCFLDVIFCLYRQFPGSHLVWQSADLKYNFGNRRRFPLQWLLALCYMGVRSANVHCLLIVVLKDGTGFFDWSVLLCWGVEVGNRLGGSFSWGEEDSGCVVLFWWIEKVGGGWAAPPCTAVKDCVNTAFKWFVRACCWVEARLLSSLWVPVDTEGLVTSTSSGVLLGGCLAEWPCWGASVNQGLVASPCTLVKNGEGTVSLACSSVSLSGGLTASPCWGAAVGTAADSGVSTS